MKHIDINQIKHLYYTEKKSLLEIANIFDCSPTHIQFQMDQHGLPRRDARKSKISLDITEIVRLYFEEQLPLLEVGKRMGVSVPTIQKRLREAGYTLRNRSEAARLRKGSQFTDTDESEMERLYAEEERSCQEIAERFNCSVITVQKKLKKRGVQLRTLKEARALRAKKEKSEVGKCTKVENFGSCKRDVGVPNASSNFTDGQTLQTCKRSSETYTPPKRLGKVFAPIPLLPPEQVTPERILQLFKEDNLLIDDIAIICSLSRVEIYNILQENGGI